MDINETRIHIVRQESGIDPLSVFAKHYKASLGLEFGEEEQWYGMSQVCCSMRCGTVLQIGRAHTYGLFVFFEFLFRAGTAMKES